MRDGGRLKGSSQESYNEFTHVWTFGPDDKFTGGATFPSYSTFHLPGMPGEEILKLLKEDPDTQEIPVVVVSADATRSRIERVLDAGAHAYLTKPLDVRPLPGDRRRSLEAH